MAAGAVRPQAPRGEPDDVGVDRDRGGGVARAVVWPAGAGVEHAGQGLMPGAGGELMQAPWLARDTGADAQGAAQLTETQPSNGSDTLRLAQLVCDRTLAAPPSAAASPWCSRGAQRWARLAPAKRGGERGRAANTGWAGRRASGGRRSPSRREGPCQASQGPFSDLAPRPSALWPAPRISCSPRPFCPSCCLHACPFFPHHRIGA